MNSNKASAVGSFPWKGSSSHSCLPPWQYWHIIQKHKTKHGECLQTIWRMIKTEVCTFQQWVRQRECCFLRRWGRAGEFNVWFVDTDFDNEEVCKVTIVCFQQMCLSEVYMASYRMVSKTLSRYNCLRAFACCCSSVNHKVLIVSKSRVCLVFPSPTWRHIKVNTPFFNITFFLFFFFNYRHLPASIQQKPLFLLLYPLLSFSLITQNWKYTANPCLQMWRFPFCQQAGYHLKNLTGRAHLPSALSWQRGTRRNDQVSQILNMKDETCLASEAQCCLVCGPTVGLENTVIC